MTTKAFSLAAELAMLGRAVQGVTDLLDVENINGLEIDRAGEDAAAMLHLIASRLRQLRSVVVGAQDPKILIAPHNEAGDPAPHDDPDTRFHSWPRSLRLERRKKPR